MEKITFFDSGRKRIKKAKRWLRLLSISTAFFVGQSVFAQDSGTIQIGAGTATASGSQAMPVSNYNFNYSQQIITAAEYASGGGAAGEITKLRYKITTVGTFTVWNNWRVFIGNTTKTAFTSKTDWIPMSELEEVFNGNIVSVAPTAGDWIEITFTTPFDYTGGNIVVAIDENTPGWTTSPAWASYTSTAGAGLLYRSDDINHDPTVSNPPDPATTTSDFSDEAYVLALVPQIQFEGTLADCVAPLGLVSSNVTATTANVSWDESGSTSALGYEYFISTSNAFPTGAGISSGSNAETYAELDNLTPQTVYYLFVRTDCGSGSFSEWSIPSSFTTACAPLSTYPHLEPFNNVLPNDCWLVGQEGDLLTGPEDFEYSNWNEDGFANNGFEGAIRYNLYYTGANDWIISPQFTIPATGYELKFDVAATDYNTTSAVSLWEEDDTIELLVSTNGTSDWVVLESYNSLNIPSNTGSVGLYNLDDYSGETVRFAFRAIHGTEIGDSDIEFFVDNFELRVAPLCPDQTGLVVSSITSNSASTSWDDMSASGAIGYEYAVTTSATPPAIGEATTDIFYLAEGLTPQTVYYLHVRTSCAGGEFGYWVTSAPFTTQCVAFTTLPYIENFDTYGTGSDAFPVCWTRPVTFTEWLVWPSIVDFNSVSEPNSLKFQSEVGTPTYAVSPAFVEDIHNLRVKFSLKREGTFSGTFEVGVMSNPSDTSTFELVQTIDPDNNDYNQYAINFDSTQLQGGNKYVAFRHNSDSDYWYYWVDNFVVELIPSCPDVTGLVAGSITHNSADVSWDDMSDLGVESYEYAVTTSVTPPTAGDDIDDTFDSVSGLDSNTVYYLHVRSVCDAGEFGAWITYSFTTLVAPATIPWTEQFADASLPDGWSLNPDWSWNIDDGYNGWNDVYYIPGSTGDFIYKNVYSAFTTGASFTTISIGEVGDGNILSFNYAAFPYDPEDTVVNGNFVVSISADGGAFTEIETVDTVGSLTWDNTFGPYDLSAYEGQYIQVRITANWGGGSSDDYYIGFDNFYIGPDLSSPQFDKSALKVYPNPTRNILNITYNQEISNVEVYNLVGQSVANITPNANEGQIDMSNLASGAYFVKVTSNNTTKTVKVIKQ